MDAKALSQKVTDYNSFVELFANKDAAEVAKNKSGVKLLNTLLKNLETVSLQTLMQKRDVEVGNCMSNEVGDRIASYLNILKDDDEFSGKLDVLLNHFNTYIDDPENTLVGNFVDDKVVKIIVRQQKLIGLQTAISEVNLMHIDRRQPNNKLVPFEIYQVLRRGTIGMYPLEDGNYVFCRVMKDIRIIHDKCVIQVCVDTEEKEVVEIKVNDFYVIGSDIADTNAFGGSLMGLTKDYAQVRLEEIKKEVRLEFKNRLNEKGCDIGLIEHPEKLRKTDIKRLEELSAQLKTLSTEKIKEFEDLIDEMTEVLRKKLSTMVYEVRSGVVNTYVLLSNREKSRIINIIYQDWARKEFDMYMKLAEKIKKELKKEKKEIMKTESVQNRMNEENKAVQEKAMEMLVDSGYAKSISLENVDNNPEGVLYNQFIVTSMIESFDMNDKEVKEFKQKVVENAMDYFGKLRNIALGEIKVKDVKEMSDSDAISQFEKFSETKQDENYKLLLEEMKRVEELIIANQSETSGPHSEKAVESLLMNEFKLINDKIQELVDKNKDVFDQYYAEKSIEKRQQVDLGAILSVKHILQMYRTESQSK